MTIQRLRRKAEAELGDKFDIREFHAQVLMTGALPLAILEQKIDRWIAAQERRRSDARARGIRPHASRSSSRIIGRFLTSFLTKLVS